MALGVLSVSAGCEPAPTATVLPMPTLNTTGPFLPGVSTETLLKRFGDHAMACNPVGRQNGFDVVRCTIDGRDMPSGATDRTTYVVEFRASGDAVHSLRATVDQSLNATANDDFVLGYFASTVARGLTSTDLSMFVRDGVRSGGQRIVNGLVLTVGGPPAMRVFEARPAAPST